MFFNQARCYELWKKILSEFLFFKKKIKLTLKVHKYLIFQWKVWLSRWGVHPTHDLKHVMVIRPHKSHWWQNPSYTLECFVTFLTLELNFSCKRLSQRYVSTNPYRSRSEDSHSCPSPSLFPLEKSGAATHCESWAPGTPSNSGGGGGGELCLQTDSDRQSQPARSCHAPPWAAPQSCPRSKGSPCTDVKRLLNSQNRDRLKFCGPVVRCISQWFFNTHSIFILSIFFSIRGLKINTHISGFSWNGRTGNKFCISL